MSKVKISLQEVLDQRDKRKYYLDQTKEDYPNHAIISFKMNIPGPLKNDDDLLFAFNEGLKQIKDAQVVFDWRNNRTGPEAILIQEKDIQETKKKMIEIEENFALGRIFDLDVMNSNREALKLPSRKCLICDEEAHACSRSRKHGLEEVLNKIYTMIQQYKDEEKNDF